ncbi:hypothetical protein GQ53DRAFT_396968 [Thozetella sp. PMI_491]|nr:hypothetical protein GQ53DRAFT_396968 [Thozetella sp. PMI_491]
MVNLAREVAQYSFVVGWAPSHGEANPRTAASPPCYGPSSIATRLLSGPACARSPASTSVAVCFSAEVVVILPSPTPSHSLLLTSPVALSRPLHPFLSLRLGDLVSRDSTFITLTWPFRPKQSPDPARLSTPTLFHVSIPGIPHREILFSDRQKSSLTLYQRRPRREREIRIARALLHLPAPIAPLDHSCPTPIHLRPSSDWLSLQPTRIAIVAFTLSHPSWWFDS